MKSVFIATLLIVSYSGFSQELLTNIDFDRIPQKKIRSFLNDQIENQKVCFSDIEPSYDISLENSYPGYDFVEDTFLIKEDLNTVWDAYCSTRMAESWNGKKISFGLLLSKWTDLIMYCNDHNYAALDTGQVFFVNLKMLKGVYNLAVGFEIIDIDRLNHTIQFSYIKGGKSEGAQTIHFFPTDEGFTRLVHVSEFRSSSQFRDKRLYPHFHKKLIYEFHQNMLHSMGKDEKELELISFVN
jgi:hypothetical protein